MVDGEVPRFRTRLPLADLMALQTAWREFAALHRRENEEGKHWALDDDALSPALFGPATIR